MKIVSQAALSILLLSVAGCGKKTIHTPSSQQQVVVHEFEERTVVYNDNNEEELEVRHQKVRVSGVQHNNAASEEIIK